MIRINPNLGQYSITLLSVLSLEYQQVTIPFYLARILQCQRPGLLLGGSQNYPKHIRQRPDEESAQSRR